MIVAEHLDIFVSNAGISKAAAMEDHTIEDFGKLYATNMRSGDAARCQSVLLRIEVHRPCSISSAWKEEGVTCACRDDASER